MAQVNLGGRLVDLPVGTNIPRYLSDISTGDRQRRQIRADLKLAREGNAAALSRLKQQGIQDRELRQLGIQADFEAARAKSGAIGKGLAALDPFVQQFAQRGEDEPAIGQDVLDAVESAIREQGEDEQGRLSSRLASRGIFRGAASGRLAALTEAKTRSGVAIKRGEFAQEAAQRSLTAELSRRQMLADLLGQQTGLIGLDPGTPGGGGDSITGALIGGVQASVLPYINDGQSRIAI